MRTDWFGITILASPRATATQFNMLWATPKMQLTLKTSYLFASVDGLVLQLVVIAFRVDRFLRLQQ